MALTDKDIKNVESSRVCGWLVYRPGRSHRVELWEKWWPSTMMYQVHIQHCSKAVQLTRDFAVGESSIRSRQLAASLLERRIDPIHVRLCYETFASEFINGLHAPVGKMTWVITKERLLQWWLWKREQLAGDADPLELVSSGGRR